MKSFISSVKKCQDDTDSSYCFAFNKGPSQPLKIPSVLLGIVPRSPYERPVMQTKYELKIELNELPQSLNVKLRKHWTKQRRESKLWNTLIYQKVFRQLPPSPLKRAKIRIVKHFWRTMDFDGFVGSLKPVVDALVTAGVIEDDSWKVLQAWEVDQVFRAQKDGPLLQIEIKEI